MAKQISSAEPIFRIECDADPVFEDGRRGITATAGTKLFVFNHEIPNVHSLRYSHEFGEANDLIKTKIEIVLVGSQVRVELRKWPTGS